MRVLNLLVITYSLLQSQILGATGGCTGCGPAIVDRFGDTYSLSLDRGESSFLAVFGHKVLNDLDEEESVAKGLSFLDATVPQFSQSLREMYMGPKKIKIYVREINTEEFKKSPAGKKLWDRYRELGIVQEGDEVAALQNPFYLVIDETVLAKIKKFPEPERTQKLSALLRREMVRYQQIKEDIRAPILTNVPVGYSKACYPELASGKAEVSKKVREDALSRVESAIRAGQDSPTAMKQLLKDACFYEPITKEVYDKKLAEAHDYLRSKLNEWEIECKTTNFTFVDMHHLLQDSGMEYLGHMKRNRQSLRLELAIKMYESLGLFNPEQSEFFRVASEDAIKEKVLEFATDQDQRVEICARLDDARRAVGLPVRKKGAIKDSVFIANKCAIQKEIFVSDRTELNDSVEKFFAVVKRKGDAIRAKIIEGFEARSVDEILKSTQSLNPKEMILMANYVMNKYPDSADIYSEFEMYGISYKHLIDAGYFKKSDLVLSMEDFKGIVEIPSGALETHRQIESRFKIFNFDQSVRAIGGEEEFSLRGSYDLRTGNLDIGSANRFSSKIRVSASGLTPCLEKGFLDKEKPQASIVKIIPPKEELETPTSVSPASSSKAKSLELNPADGI